MENKYIEDRKYSEEEIKKDREYFEATNGLLNPIEILYKQKLKN